MLPIFHNAKKTRGAALLIFVILFLVASLTLTLSISRGVYDDLVAYRTLYEGKRSFYGAEAGIEDAIHRHRQAKQYSSTESFTFENTAVSVTRTTSGSEFHFVSEGDAHDAIRQSDMTLTLGNGVSFNFGMQAGNGGIFMENNSAVRGNVFANGSVVGANNNIVYGEVVSAGPSGLIDTVHATGSAWAHTIDSAIIDRDAYYQSITGSIVAGTQYPGSIDQGTTSLPISDDDIEGWKALAVAGGTTASTSPQCSGGVYTIDSDETIGPVKIECDLLIEGNSTDVYIAGEVWISGDIDIKNNPRIRVAAGVTGGGTPLIADNPSDNHMSGTITLQNNAVFYGNGANSYVLLISQNDSSEDGGSEVAVNMKNNATGAVLLYAGHGEVLIENGSGLKEVTGYKVHTKNNTEVVYESGLASLLFSSGPGGGYTVTSWGETE